jgi:hypothetical protein
MRHGGPGFNLNASPAKLVPFPNQGGHAAKFITGAFPAPQTGVNSAA